MYRIYQRIKRRADRRLRHGEILEMCGGLWSRKSVMLDVYHVIVRLRMDDNTNRKSTDFIIRTYIPLYCRLSTTGIPSLEFYS